MNERIEDVLDTLDELRSADEITYSAYSTLHDEISLLDDLLKEQEPVKAVADGEDSYRCNNCGTVIGWAEWEPGGIEEVKYKFCPECGRAVKWDA